MNGAVLHHGYRFPLGFQVEACSRIEAGCKKRPSDIFLIKITVDKPVLDNAEQHMPAEGTITVSADKPEDAILRLRFRDTGSGIASEDSAHIFEPFFTTRKAGTGLGLSIVKNTVENHDGAIRIFNNDPPPGITVEIRMPLAGVIQ